MVIKNWVISVNCIVHWTEGWEYVYNPKVSRKISVMSVDTGYGCNKSRICIPKCMEEDDCPGAFPVAKNGCAFTVSSFVLLPSSDSWASNQPVCSNLQQTYWWVWVACCSQTSILHDLLLRKVRIYEFHLKLCVFIFFMRLSPMWASFCPSENYLIYLTNVPLQEFQKQFLLWQGRRQGKIDLVGETQTCTVLKDHTQVVLI